MAAREANLKSTREAVAAQQGAAQVRRSDDAHTAISTLTHAAGFLQSCKACWHLVVASSVATGCLIHVKWRLQVPLCMPLALNPLAPPPAGTG